ncbi:Oog1 [Lemmus lemmus]
MGDQAPPTTLQQLAIESLLKEEALAVSAVVGLPWFLFPAIFEVAFRNNHTSILRAMVPAWPFTCLPVGALMKTPHLETLKALLDGLDVLITEEACPRCLKKPLETLSITFCHLIQRDLDYLPQCQNLSGLKHLYLSHTILEEWFKPLGKLLERVKDTLQTLDLEKCWLEDSAFNDFMPALSQCSQLLKINFFNNKLSLPLLKQLLQHTAKLNKLTQELYPVPLECYDNRGLLLRERFDEICPELLDILRTKRQPKAVSFVSSICPTCFQSCVYDLESRYCLCWQ